MQAAVPQITAGGVLRAFRSDAPYLFLGAIFAAVGLVAAAFAAIRRRRDLLLIYFALFALLYGLRLWIQSGLLGITMQGSPIYTRLNAGINYVILIPALLFFTALRLLPGRVDQIIGYTLIAIGGALAAATFMFGPAPVYGSINNIVVITALIVMGANVMRRSPAEGEARAEFVAVRWGLLIFVLFAVWDNVAGLRALSLPRAEPFGFAAFLSCLGYVAARRTLARDQQLQEIQKELEVARRIQLSILPGEFPASKHFSVAARYVPMTSVAGDFYDYVVADEHQAGLLIADVSGHGVPAALIASMVKLAAASQRALAADPSRFLSGVNLALLGNTQSQFVTAAYVHLDADSRQIRYSAAGHPPMLLLRNGGVTEVEENGLMLAAFNFASYSTRVHPLEPGDRLVLYTDGIVEASNRAGEFFGQDALRELLKNTAAHPPSAAADAIISSVRQWSAKQDDDLTVLICDYVAGDSNPRD